MSHREDAHAPATATHSARMGGNDTGATSGRQEADTMSEKDRTMTADDTGRDALVERVARMFADDRNPSRDPIVTAMFRDIGAVAMPLAQERDAEFEMATGYMEERDTWRERWRQLMREHEAVVKERDALEAERDQALAELDDRFAESDHKAAKWYRKWLQARAAHQALTDAVRKLAVEAIEHPRAQGEVWHGDLQAVLDEHGAAS